MGPVKHLITIMASFLLLSCSSSHTVDVPTRPPTRPEAAGLRTPNSARPVALIDQRAVSLNDMQEELLEAAGGQIIRELRLQRALEGRLAEEEITLSDAAIQAEEARLLDELNPDSDVAQLLLKTVQESEGLGPRRYEALLWRNAALRALIQKFVSVDEEAMRRVWEVTYGPQVRVRVIVVASYTKAATVVEKLRQGDNFDQLATEWSIDPSRDRGGLLEKLSTVDPVYPTALREAIDELEPGEFTNPVLLGDRYLLALLEKRIPAQDMTFAEVKSLLEVKTRLAQERMLMQEEAYRLRDEPKLLIFDETLQQSYLATDPEKK